MKWPYLESVSTGTGCDGGFPEKIKAQEKDIDNEEDTSNSSGVQSNSNYSEDFSDGGGGPGGGGLHYSAGSGLATNEMLYFSINYVKQLTLFDTLWLSRPG